MKKLMLAAAVMAVAGASAAVAEGNRASPTSLTPAISTPGSVNPHAPVAGRNSFTEAQIRQRLADDGFTNVGGLKQDDNGIWHATARKGNAAHAVMVDYQGNVTAHPAKR